MAPDAHGGQRRLPEPTVARLPIYERIVGEIKRAGATTISSERLAELAGVNAAKVRKDLSLLGSLGTRGTGYEVTSLIARINATLGADRRWSVIVAGAGNLGRALVNARGFLAGGYHLVGVVDVDPEVLGTTIGGVAVRSYDEIASHLEDPPALGIITTPARAAQAAADQLMALGVRSLLNFAPRVLVTPPEVRVRYVDLSIELQVLSYHALHDEAMPPASLSASLGIEPTEGTVQAAAEELGVTS